MMKRSVLGLTISLCFITFMFAHSTVQTLAEDIILDERPSPSPPAPGATPIPPPLCSEPVVPDLRPQKTALPLSELPCTFIYTGNVVNECLDKKNKHHTYVDFAVDVQDGNQAHWTIHEKPFGVWEISMWSYKEGTPVIRFGFNSWLPFSSPYADEFEIKYCPSPQSCSNVNYDGVVLFENESCKGKLAAYDQPVFALIANSFIPNSIYVGSGWSATVYDGKTNTSNKRCINSSLWNLDQEYYPDSNSSIEIANNIASIEVFHDDNCGGQDSNKDGTVDRIRTSDCGQLVQATSCNGGLTAFGSYLFRSCHSDISYLLQGVVDLPQVGAYYIVPNPIFEATSLQCVRGIIDQGNTTIAGSLKNWFPPYDSIESCDLCASPFEMVDPQVPNAIVIAQGLNVRTGPGSRDYNKTGEVLSNGDELTVTGRNQDCSWLQVITPAGNKGWVSGSNKHVTLNLSCDLIPITDIPPTPTPKSIPSLTPTPTNTLPPTATPTQTPTSVPAPRPTATIAPLPPAPTPTPVANPSPVGTVLFDADPRTNRYKDGQYFCSGFSSDCDFNNCSPNQKIIGGPYCRSGDYPYIRPGLYRITLQGRGSITAGATDYGPAKQLFSFGKFEGTLPMSFNFCWPGRAENGFGFETMVISNDAQASVSNIRVEYLGPDCGSAPVIPTPQPTSPSQPPNIVFDAERREISAGECIRLYWDVEQAQAVYFEGQPTVGHDTRDVCPNETTTYVLTVHTDSGVKEIPVTVTVNRPAGVYINFRAEPDKINVGECTMLRWDVDNVSAVYVGDHGTSLNGVTGHGQQPLCLPETRSYDLRVVTKDGQEVIRTVTITVQGAPQPTAFSCSNVPDIPQIECEALVAFHNHTYGSDGKPYFSYWLSGGTPCGAWDSYVYCDTGRRHIVGLELGIYGAPREVELHGNVHGTIPSELGNLSKLQTLDLSDLALSGSLPLALMNLRELRSFTFDNTNLCEPTDPAFQAWLNSIEYLTRTGIPCPP